MRFSCYKIFKRNFSYAFITMKEKQETTDAHLFVQTITQQAEEIGRLKEQIRQMNLEKGKPASDAYTSGDANVG